MRFLPQQSTSSQPEETYTQEKLIKNQKKFIKVTVSKREPVLFMNIYRVGGRKKIVLTWTLSKNKKRKTGPRSRRASQEHTHTLALSLSLSLSLSLRDGLTAAV
jgi:hypothetical protein